MKIILTNNYFRRKSSPLKSHRHIVGGLYSLILLTIIIFSLLFSRIVYDHPWWYFTIEIFSFPFYWGALMGPLIGWIKGFFRDPLEEFLKLHSSFSCSEIAIQYASNPQQEIVRIQKFLMGSYAMERELKNMAALPYAPELEAAFVFAATKRKKAQEFLDAQKLLHEALRALYGGGWIYYLLGIDEEIFLAIEM